MLQFNVGDALLVGQAGMSVNIKRQFNRQSDRNGGTETK